MSHTVLMPKMRNVLGVPGSVKTHSTRQMLEAMIYYCEGMYSKISRQNRLRGQNLEETRYKFPRVLSRWNYAGYTWVVTTRVKCFLPGKVISEVPCPGFLLGAGRIDTLCLAHTKFPGLRGKAVVRHKPHYLHKQSRLSEPQGMVGSIRKSTFPDSSRGPTLQAGLLRGSMLGPATLTLLCTRGLKKMIVMQLDKFND